MVYSNLDDEDCRIPGMGRREASESGIGDAAFDVGVDRPPVPVLLVPVGSFPLVPTEERLPDALGNWWMYGRSADFGRKAVR